MPLVPNKFYSIFTLFIVIFFTVNTAQAKDAEASVDLKKEIKEYITHHLQDAYDFSLFSYTNKSGKHIYIGFPLPVILWDEELHVFLSSKLDHGEKLVASGNKYYKLDKQKQKYLKQIRIYIYI